MERVLTFVGVLMVVGTSACMSQSASKAASVFFPASIRAAAQENCSKHSWAKAIREKLIADAEPWMKLSDDQLWSLMFGPRITRSWMVWSNGFCPACKEGVPMYNWVMDAMNQPWKVRCPHCKQLFPTNDFEAFHRSGFDEHGIFDPDRADRSLLFNVAHPDAADPLHQFGVDDGEGYVDGGNRWRFIGAYLIYGQWKQAIVGGASKLAAAYAVTGNAAYAHRAGVLLDRAADLLPDFDFGKQGLVYEVKGAAGHVSTWHDACWETRQLAFAYDQVFDAIRVDDELPRFLSAKSRKYGLENPKSSFADIQRNIEDRALTDAVTNRRKIESNYPQTDFTIAIIRTVIGWPGNREEVRGILEGVLDKATAVDGLTGEKGVTNYTSLSPRTVADILERYARVDPEFLSSLLESRPKLYDGYRFYVDTHCLDRYYPNSGDSGVFGKPQLEYRGVNFARQPGIEPSGYGFLWRLYEATGDPAFVQGLYSANDSSVQDLPHDLFARDPESMQAAVKQIIEREGTSPKKNSVNYEQWRLALLRSGKAENERVVVLDYDSSGQHSHRDGLTLGLFGKGLDLMPDFGYPPVQYGGWGSSRSTWYMKTAAHNTVVIDGADQNHVDGRSTLWADGAAFRAARVSAPEMYRCSQYERTAALVDVSGSDGYVLDVFRVIGGKEHAKFVRGFTGTASTDGLDLAPIATWQKTEHMRRMSEDPAPKPGWRAEWRFEDLFEALPDGSQPRLRCTELTNGASASIGECWISLGYGGYDELWVPQLMVRRQSDSAPLESTFVSVIEPYAGRPLISSVRRLAVQDLEGATYPDSTVAVEVTLADGRRDLLVCADVENPLSHTPAYSPTGALVVPEWKVELRGEMCLVRRNAGGNIERTALCGKPSDGGAVSLAIDGEKISVPAGDEFVEMTWRGGVRRVVSSGR